MIMSDWVLVPSLVKLRSEFNAVNPNRDKGADGSIGDAKHTPSSDHSPDEDSAILRDHDADSKNEVHALDIDSSGPWPGEGTQKQRFDRLVKKVIAGEKAKRLDAKDKCRLNYAIWDGLIYDKDRDFAPVVYHGSDNHTNHAHFSARYETRAENDTRPFLEEDMSLSTEDIQAIASKISVDLNNPDSGISRGLRKNLHAFLDETRAYTGKAGQRITGRGWGELSTWGLLQYLFELVATDPRQVVGPDGSVTELSGGVLPRLDRIETAVSEDPIATQP